MGSLRFSIYLQSRNLKNQKVQYAIKWFIEADRRSKYSRNST